MNHIVPAIIPESLEHLREALFSVRPFTREVQVDIVDGKFVPFTSWPYLPGASVHDIALFTPTFAIEVDLMLERPEEVIPQYRQAGIRKVVVHVESTENLERVFIQKRDLGFELGLSAHNDTPLGALEEHLDRADYVQLMGIAKIGSQGQPFDERVLERISELRARHPDLTVSIDGSVNRETALRLIKAGANRLVSGSAILKAENPREAYRELSALF